MILVYTKEKYPKFLFDINLDLKTALEVTNNNLFIDNPEYGVENTIVIERDNKFLHPISDDLETIREMSREEVCATGNLTILQDGEKYEDGHIVQVPNPSTQYLSYSWNRETFNWELITTKEELVSLRSYKITQVQQIKRDLQDLIDFGDSELEITQLEELKAMLMQEIQKLAELIKKM